MKGIGTTCSAPAQTAVSNSASKVLSANGSRAELIVVNTGTVPVFLGFGPAQPSATAYHVALAPCSSANDGTGGSFVCDWWEGDVYAIAPAGGGTICIGELSE
jgi:hypothetical protein